MIKENPVIDLATDEQQRIFKLTAPQKSASGLEIAMLYTISIAHVGTLWS